MSTENIRDEALSLPSEERALLAHELLRSLDGPTDEDADSAWIEEIEKRAAELSDGSATAVDWQEARERILKRLRDRRS